MLANQSISSDVVTPSTPLKIRQHVTGNSPLVLAEIYEDIINIAIWQRELTPSLQRSIQKLIHAQPRFQTAITVSPDHAASALINEFGSKEYSDLAANIAELVDMFCSLFDLKQTGLRLAVLDKAMCPKFHVDRVPCRLVTTYQGIATEWLPHTKVNRSQLGLNSVQSNGKQAEIYQKQTDIQQLQAGEVALLKGESWHNNENAGLVHRSPAVVAGSSRLLLTLDFSA